VLKQFTVLKLTPYSRQEQLSALREGERIAVGLERLCISDVPTGHDVRTKFREDLV
jgi:hypothetical protein